MKVYDRSGGCREKEAHLSGNQYNVGDITPLTHLESISGMATPIATTKGSNRGQYEEAASLWELAKIWGCLPFQIRVQSSTNSLIWRTGIGRRTRIWETATPYHEYCILQH